MDDLTFGRLIESPSSYLGSSLSAEPVENGSTEALLPVQIAREGANAKRRFLEFFAATIRNKNTRMAYYRAVIKFFTWCERRGVRELRRIEPMLVAAFIEEETAKCEAQTVKQELAAIRKMFDWLVIGHIVSHNPASSVRGPSYSLTVGKTPVLTREEARLLLENIPLSRNGVPDLVGLRDRALVGLMIYSFARISALLAMEVSDYAPRGKRYWISLHEKGGKFHRLPVHHLAEEYLDAYLLAACIGDEKKSPLWRSAHGRSGQLTALGMTRVDAFRMIRRRAKTVGLPLDIGCHTFRATGITAYLQNGGSIEGAQEIAAHSSPRTTKLYDRRNEDISLDEIERIRL